MNSFTRLTVLAAVAASAVAFFAFAQEKQKPMTTSDTPPPQPEKKVTRTDAEWRKLLTPEQYRIARQSGTERPNGAVYKDFKKHGGGTYYCVGCNAELFSSNEKFDAQCGWPSFYDPSKAKNVKSVPDPDGRRIEVRCAVCDSHLGHVFLGEGFNTPTDKRYCINGTVLKFVPHKAKKDTAKSSKKGTPSNEK